MGKYLQIRRVAEVLASFAAGGIDKECLGRDRVEKLLSIVFKEFEDQGGLLGFASGIQPDADDTAQGIIALNMLGYPVSAVELVESFGQDEWFKTYPQERTISISTNCNALMAMMSNHENLRAHSKKIVNLIQHLCSEWFQKPKANDKWNLSFYYHTMLLARAFPLAMESRSHGQLDASKGLFEDELPLVLIQILVQIIKAQCADGSWDSDRETTAYAMLTIAGLRNLPPGQLLGQEIEAAMRNGRYYLAENMEPKSGPSMLWNEKVTYGSVNLTEAYILAALHSSSLDWLDHPGKTGYVCPESWAKSVSMGNFYKKIPILEKVPTWLISESLVEGLLFTGRLTQKYQEVLQDYDAGGKHLQFIPFTWTVTARLVEAGLSSQTQLDMMTVSALLYALDQYMEAKIGTKTMRERKIVRDSVNNDFEYLRIHQCLPAVPFMDKLLCQVFSFMWDHPKVQIASDADKSQLLTHVRLLYLAHLEQLDDNETLRKSRLSELTGKTGLRNRHSSLYEWIQATSGHHTGGGAAFSFFLCIIATFTTALPTSRARYISAKLSQSLRALSRIQNDYGSLERDYVEGNLNCTDFLRRLSLAEQAVLGGSSELDRSQAFKEELRALAVHEKELCDSLIQGELAQLISSSTLSALELFVATVEVYGELYMLKDHTPSILSVLQNRGQFSPEVRYEFQLTQV